MGAYFIYLKESYMKKHNYYSYHWIDKALKYLRIKNKYTQKQVSEGVGISQTSVSGHEKGYSTPNLYIIASYCSFYNIELAEFFHLVSVSLDDTTPTKMNLDSTRDKVMMDLMSI